MDTTNKHIKKILTEYKDNRDFQSWMDSYTLGSYAGRGLEVLLGDIVRLHLTQVIEDGEWSGDYTRESLDRYWAAMYTVFEQELIDRGHCE